MGVGDCGAPVWMEEDPQKKNGNKAPTIVAVFEGWEKGDNLIPDSYDKDDWFTIIDRKVLDFINKLSVV